MCTWRVLVGAFFLAVAAGAGFLSLPLATASGDRASVLDAVFTSTSAACVTGLTTADTGGYWSTFGQIVILVLVQAGGLGLMTVTTLIVAFVSRRLGLHTNLITQAQTHTLTAQDIGRIIRNVTAFAAVVETVVAIVLVSRLTVASNMSFGRALYEGIFHAVSAFNNAGFSVNENNLMRHADDPWIVLTTAVAVIVGGLGFPVIFELVKTWRRPRTWSMTAKITVIATGSLLVAGTLWLMLAESDNAAIFGSTPADNRVLIAFFSATTPRTAGFTVVDTGAMSPEGLLFTVLLMFIGGGSAGVAGGIKVTTFGLLIVVLWAKIRDHGRCFNARHRKVSADDLRQALVITVLGATIASIATAVLLFVSEFSPVQVVVETVSALSTVGLSTGITSDLPNSGKWLIIALMNVGYLGPPALMSKLTLKQRQQQQFCERPPERITIG